MSSGGLPGPEVYLAPGFEPNSLKVAQLRGILVAHRITAPSTAKKADLVYLFEREVVSKAKAYHQSAASVVPSIEGIREIDNNGNEVTPPRPNIPAPIPAASTSAPGTGMRKSKSQSGLRNVAQGGSTEGEGSAGTGTGVGKKRGRKSVMPSSALGEGQGEGDVFGGGGGVEEVKPRRTTRRSSATPTPTVPDGLPGRNSTASPDFEILPTTSASASKGKGSRGARKAPSGEVLREEEEEEEEEGGKGKAKVGRGEEASSAPETTRRESKAPRRSAISPEGEGEGAASGFSDFNPFQSGGEESPEKGEGEKIREKRKKRQTVGGESTARRHQVYPPPTEDEPYVTPSKPIASTSTAVTPPSLSKFQPDLRSAKVPVDSWKAEHRPLPKSSPAGSSRVDVSLRREVIEDARDLEGAEDWQGYNDAVGDRIAGIEQVVEQESASGDDEMESEEDVRAVSQVRKKGKELAVIAKEEARDLVASSTPSGQAQNGMRLTTLALLFALLAWTYQYQQESAKIGYCDTDKGINSIMRVKQDHQIRAMNCVEDRAQRLKDSPLGSGEKLSRCEYEQELPLFPFLPRPEACTPCPSNAICETGAVIGCQGDYILEPHLLDQVSSVFDGLPGFGPVAFPPTCELDVKTRQKIGQIAKAVEAHLAVRKGEEICNGGRVGRKGESEVERFGVEEERLRERFVAKVNIPVDHFNQIFNTAMEDLVIHKNLIRENIHGHIFYAATRAEMPLGCRLRLAATEKVVESKKEIGLSSSAALLLTYLYSSLKKRRAENTKVKGLVSVALTRLQDQQYLNQVEPSQAPHRYLLPDQLRDHVLQHIHSPAERRRLWSQVRKIIEANANVKTSDEEVDGEIWPIWEWIGANKLSGEYGSIEG